MCFSSPKVQAPPTPPPAPPPPVQLAQRVETPASQRTGTKVKRKRGTSQLTVNRSGGVNTSKSGTGININQ